MPTTRTTATRTLATREDFIRKIKDFRRFHSIKRFWTDSIQESDDSSGFETSNRVAPVEQQKTNGSGAEGPTEKRFREDESRILTKEILYYEPGCTKFVDPASSQHHSEEARSLSGIQKNQRSEERRVGKECRSR